FAFLTQSRFVNKLGFLGPSVQGILLRPHLDLQTFLAVTFSVLLRSRTEFHKSASKVTFWLDALDPICSKRVSSKVTGGSSCQRSLTEIRFAKSRTYSSAARQESSATANALGWQSEFIRLRQPGRW